LLSPSSLSSTYALARWNALANSVLGEAVEVELYLDAADGWLYSVLSDCALWISVPWLYVLPALKGVAAGRGTVLVATVSGPPFMDCGG